MERRFESLDEVEVALDEFMDHGDALRGHIKKRVQRKKLSSLTKAIGQNYNEFKAQGLSPIQAVTRAVTEEITKLPLEERGLDDIGGIVPKLLLSLGGMNDVLRGEVFDVMNSVRDDLHALFPEIEPNRREERTTQIQDIRGLNVTIDHQMKSGHGVTLSLKRCSTEGVANEDLAILSNAIRERYLEFCEGGKQPPFLALVAAVMEKLTKHDGRKLKDHSFKLVANVLLGLIAELGPLSSELKKEIPSLVQKLIDGIKVVDVNVVELIEDPTALAGKTLEWLEKVGIGAPILLSELKRYRDSTVMGKRIAFPYINNEELGGRADRKEIPNLHKLICMWAVPMDGTRGWTSEEYDQVNNLLHYLTRIVQLLSESASISKIYDASNRISLTLDYLKREKGVHVTGVDAHVENVRADFRTFPMGVPENLSIAMDPTVMAYHAMYAVFKMAGCEDRDPLSVADREFAFNKLLEVEKAKGGDDFKNRINWITRYVKKVLEPLLAGYSPKVKASMQVVEADFDLGGTVKQALAWREEVGVGSEEMTTRLQAYLDDESFREPVNVFPFRSESQHRQSTSLDAETIPEVEKYAAFHASRRGMDFNEEGLENAEELVWQLTNQLSKLRNSSSMTELYTGLKYVLTVWKWMADQDVRIKGIPPNFMDNVNLTINSDDLHFSIPKKCKLTIDVELVAFHIVTALIELTGKSDMSPFSKEDRDFVIERLIKKMSKKEADTDEELMRWISYLRLIVDVLPNRVEVYEATEEEEVEDEIIEVEEQVEEEIFELTSFSQLRSLQNHFKLRSKGSRSTLGKKAAAIAALKELCEEHATYVAGHVSGEVSVRGKERLNVSAVKNLFTSRPNPEEIVYPGNIVSEGHFCVALGSKTFRLHWKINGEGDFFFEIAGSVHGGKAFKNPNAENFYLEMKKSVYMGLRDLLVRGGIREGGSREAVERSAGIKLEGASGVRQIRHRFEQMLTRLTNDPAEEAKRAPSGTKYIVSLIEKIKSDETIQSAELDNVDLYLKEEKDGVEIFVMVDPLSTLIAIANDPTVMEAVFLCVKQGHIGKAGYTASVLGKTRYCTKRIPSKESEQRLALVRERFRLGDLDKRVDQSTKANVNLGPEIDNPYIDKIVLGSEQSVGLHRLGEPNDCVEITVKQLLQKYRGELDVPAMIMAVNLAKTSGSDTRFSLSTRLQASQLAQFNQGAFPSLAEAVAKLGAK